MNLGRFPAGLTVDSYGFGILTLARKAEIEWREGGEIAREVEGAELAALYLQFTDVRKEAMLKGWNAMRRLPWKESCIAPSIQGWRISWLEGETQSDTA